MSILGVIPARYASQRFPGKPLALIGGRPMVYWVYQAASSCAAFDRVVVATDDRRIADVVNEFGGQVELTRSDHSTGTDRVAEVAERYPQAEIVANIQGDQPFVSAPMLEALIAPLRAGEPAEMSTLACPLIGDAWGDDPNVVKVVCDQRMRALYFSRASIPHFRQRHEAPVFHHLGLYAFRRDFLQVYSTLSPTPLEQCEQLEQLRVLENGYAIRVGLTEKPIIEVNTPDDLEQANALVLSRGG